MADRWWWSLTEQRVLPDAEKGPADQVLGPYPSREAAERWRDRVDARNEAWDQDDDAWSGDDDRDDAGG